MTPKSLLLAATLALAAIANAKSYDITLTAPVKAGSVQLTAGEYSFRVQGSNAIFTNLQTGKSFTTAVNAESGDKKYSMTAVICNTQDASSRMTSVELGGTATKLELGD